MEIKVKLFDLTKLKSISNFAKLINKTTVWVYKLGKDKEIDIIDVEGFKFVYMNNKANELIEKSK